MPLADKKGMPLISNAECFISTFIVRASQLQILRWGLGSD